MTDQPLSSKLTIEEFRSDEWFNENIWEDDLDGNEIVELTLQEVSKDINKSVLKTIQDINYNHSTDLVSKEFVNRCILDNFGSLAEEKKDE